MIDRRLKWILLSGILFLGSCSPFFSFKNLILPWDASHPFGNGHYFEISKGNHEPLMLRKQGFFSYTWLDVKKNPDGPGTEILFARVKPSRDWLGEHIFIYQVKQKIDVNSKEYENYKKVGLSKEYVYTYGVAVKRDKNSDKIYSFDLNNRSDSPSSEFRVQSLSQLRKKISERLIEKAPHPETFFRNRSPHIVKRYSKEEFDQRVHDIRVAAEEKAEAERKRQEEAARRAAEQKRLEEEKKRRQLAGQPSELSMAIAYDKKMKTDYAADLRFVSPPAFGQPALKKSFQKKSCTYLETDTFECAFTIKKPVRTAFASPPQSEQLTSVFFKENGTWIHFSDQRNFKKYKDTQAVKAAIAASMKAEALRKAALGNQEPTEADMLLAVQKGMARANAQLDRIAENCKRASQSKSNVDAAQCLMSGFGEINSSYFNYRLIRFTKIGQCRSLSNQRYQCQWRAKLTSTARDPITRLFIGASELEVNTSVFEKRLGSWWLVTQ